MSTKDRRPITYGAIVARLEWLEAAAVLIDNDGPCTLIDGEDVAIVNDCFDIATADAQRVHASDVRMLADLYEQYGEFVVVAYAALERGELPLHAVTSRTDYQRAFAATKEQWDATRTA